MHRTCVALVIAVAVHANGQQAHAEEPETVAGAALISLGGASIIASAAWLGTHQDAPCPVGERCSEHGVEGAALGLFTGGLTASVFGVGVALAGSTETGPRRDAFVASGVMLTGMCTAGIVGSATSLTYLFRHRDPALLAIAPTLLGSGTLCAVGLPLWILGKPVRRTVTDLDESRWRSPTMTAVGIGMTAVGATMIPAGFAYGFLESRRGPGAEGRGGIMGGLIGGLFMMLPGTPLVISGSLLLHKGSQRVPATLSFTPMPPGGVGVVLTH